GSATATDGVTKVPSQIPLNVSPLVAVGVALLGIRIFRPASFKDTWGSDWNSTALKPNPNNALLGYASLVSVAST
ncbi:MAG: hypothetical protein ACKPGT_29900, partial [Microcystis sp.]